MLWSPGELSKTTIASPTANSDGTGLGVPLMLEFLQAPQVALMSSCGWGAGGGSGNRHTPLAWKEGLLEDSKNESLPG